MKKQPTKTPAEIAESPVAEVFENRHPSEGEKKRAETTLASKYRFCDCTAVTCPPNAG